LVNSPARADDRPRTKEAAMSLRSLAALGLVLFLWGCNMPAKLNDAAID
jgi:hypothetical protein